MSIGLHCRIIGRPGRFQGLKKFVNHISTFNDVWVAKRIDIAKFWIKNFPYKLEDHDDK
jgi:peptidoglycan/xylan/chitin deacetylase (PgdA/CDA1 family)